MVTRLRMPFWTIELERKWLLVSRVVRISILDWLLGLLLEASRVQQGRGVPSRGSKGRRAVGVQRRIRRGST
jgi:hypothetical protein